MGRKILMVTMGLDIGGAETHIIELSKELKRRGHEIIIISNGGVYVEEIEKYGIRHEIAPLNSRSLGCMHKSYIILKRLIRAEKPDVVHAHARIPAFLTGLVRKSIPFNFVTTAHFMFDTSGMLKYLTNWGDKSIAVSEDIVHYLTDNYGVPRQDISVTINGIDTEKFSPETSPDSVIDEFSIDPSKPVICHVSRLDGNSSVGAEQIIEAMPLIDKGLAGVDSGMADWREAAGVGNGMADSREAAGVGNGMAGWQAAAGVGSGMTGTGKGTSGVQLLIAGAGTEFDRLKKRSDEINDMLGRRAVIMAGPRTDINEIVAAGDVFVGVSRTALEAMAAEKPAILAGNEGYLGLFGKEKLNEARETNFCCRKSEPTQAERLAADVIDCINRLGTDELAEIGRFGRQVVLDEYSVARMADDSEAVYNIVTKKKYKVLISGYYGFGNAGDEAILSSIYNNLVALGENMDISVLVANPEKSGDIYDFRMVDRFSIPQIFKAVRKCDLLISGGGSLLQDRTSTKSILYYLTIINLAKFLRKKVVMYANGIGPVLKPVNRKRVKKTVEKIDLVILRDENSAEELRRMGVSRQDLNVTADPVFTCGTVDKEQAKQLVVQAGIPTDRPFAGVSIREWYNVPNFREIMAEICDTIYDKYGYNIVFIVMQTPNDMNISIEVQGLMKNPSYIVSGVAGGYKTRDLMGIVGCADFIMCMRLHTLIFAAHMEVPTLGIVYDPKVRDYLKILGMPSMGDVDTLDRDYALQQADLLIKNRDAYVATIKKRTGLLKEKAHENEKLLLEFMKGNLQVKS